MRRVARGSRAEQGSSISRISGSTASSRAMQRRCCCSSVSESAGALSRSLHFLPHLHRVQGALQDGVQFRLPGPAVQPGTVKHVVVNGQREGVGALEDHAHFFAQLGEVDVGRQRCPGRR